MAGDRDAMVAFCERTYPRLVGALALHCGDPLMAEELAQEALLRACRRWSHVSGLESPGGWAYRVGVNLANSTFRRRRIRAQVEQRLRTEHRSHRDPDAGTAVAVRESLSELTDKQRQAVVLRFYLGHTAVEAAELMGSTPGAVRTLTHRALRVLRDEFDIDVVADEEVRDVS